MLMLLRVNTFIFVGCQREADSNSVLPNIPECGCCDHTVPKLISGYRPLATAVSYIVPLRKQVSIVPIATVELTSLYACLSREAPCYFALPLNEAVLVPGLQPQASF